MKTLPKSEDGYGVLYKFNGQKYVISQNTSKGIFTLWLKDNDEYTKISTANSPTKLYKKIEEEKV